MQSLPVGRGCDAGTERAAITQRTCSGLFRKHLHVEAHFLEVTCISEQQMLAGSHSFGSLENIHSTNGWFLQGLALSGVKISQFEVHTHPAQSCATTYSIRCCFSM